MEIDIGERFRQIRLKEHMTQRGFAKALGVSSSVVSEIERGARTPSKNVMITLCRQYDCDLNWLISGCSKIAALNNTISDKNFEIDILIKQLHAKDEQIKRLLDHSFSGQHDSTIRRKVKLSLSAGTNADAFIPCGDPIPDRDRGTLVVEKRRRGMKLRFVYMFKTKRDASQIEVHFSTFVDHSDKGESQIKLLTKDPTDPADISYISENFDGATYDSIEIDNIFIPGT